MNKRITDEERAKYTAAWKHPQYREESPAFRVRDQIIEVLGLGLTPTAPGQPPQPNEARTIKRVVDFGCGAGQLAMFLAARGVYVLAVDIAGNCVDKIPKTPFFHFLNCAIHELPDTLKGRGLIEGGYCVDVMEHIPEPLIDATLNRMSDVCEKVYFRIALFPDHWGETVGIGNLHPTVKPWQWWVAVIADYFSIERSYCEDDPHHGGRVLVVIAEVKRSSDD